MIVVTSKQPRVVADLSTAWRAGLPSNLRASVEFTGVPAVGTPTACGFSVTIGLAELIARIDTDYRVCHNLAAEMALTHDVSLRSGSGNLMNRADRIVRRVLPTWHRRARTYSPSLPHMDAEYLNVQRSAVTIYSASFGGPTHFFPGDYRVPKAGSARSEQLLHRWLGGAALVAQTQRRPCWRADDDQLVQSTSQDIHAMSRIRIDPTNPRVFFRDVVRFTTAHLSRAGERG